MANIIIFINNDNIHKYDNIRIFINRSARKMIISSNSDKQITNSDFEKSEFFNITHN